MCPPNLCLGLFTTAAVDNIDHNPSSTTAKDSFHGTGISLFQHSSADNPGTARERINISDSSDKTVIKELPSTYTDIAPVEALTYKPQLLPTTSQLKSGETNFCPAIVDEYSWLDQASTLVTGQETVDKNIPVSWAAFDSHQPSCAPPSSVAISALLPLFPDQAKSIAMIRHAMAVIKLSVEQLNPGQVPVIAFDQSLFAVAKEIQWLWPSDYGEKKFVIVFRGLHIEMAYLKVIGDWLERSGWTVALADANLAIPGTVESFLKATSVTRTRRVHQVTACSLYLLLKSAYQR